MVGCEAIIDGLKKLIANIRANCGIVGWIEPYYNTITIIEYDNRIYHQIRMLLIQLSHLTRKLCKKVVTTSNYNTTLNRQNLNDPEVEI